MARTNVSRETFAWHGSSRGTGRGDVAAGPSAVWLRGRALSGCEGERDRAGVLRAPRERFAMILRGFRESPWGLRRDFGGASAGLRRNLAETPPVFRGNRSVMAYECFT